jgi:hypothetical protein
VATHTSTNLRRCAKLLNSLHSVLYFTADLDSALAEHGVIDPMAAYVAGRAAPLGAVGPGLVTATFNAFSHRMLAEHLPALWNSVSPAEVVALRARASGTALRRFLPVEAVTVAATLAVRAAEACEPAGRPMFAANADLDLPGDLHELLWQATTSLREYRGDGHVIALGHAELTGLDALVFDCSSPAGMPKDVVMTKRGWTEQDWAAAEKRLRERGLMDAGSALTAAGTRLRADVEAETDRLDRAPYEYLGPRDAERLEDLAGELVTLAAPAFPPVLHGFFTDPQ